MVDGSAELYMEVDDQPTFRIVRLSFENVIGTTPHTEGIVCPVFCRFLVAYEPDSGIIPVEDLRRSSDDDGRHVPVRSDRRDSPFHLRAKRCNI